MTDQPSDPTLHDVHDAFVAAREDAATKDQILDEFPRQMRRIATQAGNRQARIIGAVTVVVCMAASLVTSVVSLSTAQSARAQAAAAQQQVDTALTKLGEANRQLEARGQAPVLAPPQPDPTGAIAAAVLAQVLAQLPPAPTADQVADRLAAAVLADVLGEIRPEVARQTAAYLAANPPPQGPPGESPPCLAEPTECRGEKGDPGADSTVPGPEGPEGPQGPRGEPGPVCPEGTHLEPVTFGPPGLGKEGVGCVTDDDE